MGYVVTFRCEQADQQWRLILVEQEPHAGSCSGS